MDIVLVIHEHEIAFEIIDT